MTNGSVAPAARWQILIAPIIVDQNQMLKRKKNFLLMLSVEWPLRVYLSVTACVPFCDSLLPFVAVEITIVDGVDGSVITSANSATVSVADPSSK